MKTIKRIITIVISTLILTNIYAQDNINEDMKKMPFQISFVSPLGTNGLESGNIENKVSLNIIGGYAGGLDGAEFGGFANVIKGNASGGQFAGFVNVVKSNFDGGQFAGYVNVVKSDFEGGQFAGFTNLVWGDLKGFQGSGFVNVTKGDLAIMQAAGFANVVNGNLKGAQIAGFTNVARKGLVGTQIGGFLNVASDSSKAVQIAGFGNVATDTLEGVQISGFINVAKKVKGTQISFINICDSISKGIPIGFLSIVKKGYHRFEVGGGESFQANASIKLGVDKFYNIFTAGAKLNTDKLAWGFGYGLGTEFHLFKKYNLNIELLNYFIFDENTDWSSHFDWDENNNWNRISWEFDNLTKLHITFSKQLKKHLAIFAGPTFNMAISNREDANGNLTGSLIVPWSAHTTTYKNTQIDFYPGFRLGLRF